MLIIYHVFFLLIDQGNGMVFGCKMCLHHKVFNNFKQLYAHFRNYHDGSFVTSKCRKCQKESVHTDFFLDLNELFFKEHCCQEIPAIRKQPTISEKLDSRRLVLKLNKIEKMTFSSSSNGQKYECKMCGHISVIFKNFCRHLRIRHKEMLPIIFRCKNCDFYKILQTFDDNQIEKYFEEHQCSNNEERIECIDLTKETKKQDSEIASNKRYSETSEKSEETPSKKSKIVTADSEDSDVIEIN